MEPNILTLDCQLLGKNQFINKTNLISSEKLQVNN